MAHIMMVIRNISEGGAERMVLRTAAGLVSRGHRVDVVLFEPTFAYTEDIPQHARFVILCGHARWARRKSDVMPQSTLWRGERVPVTRVARLMGKILGKYGSGCLLLLVRRRVLAYALRLARYLECEQPDIVFANLPHSEFAALFAARMVSAPICPPPIVPIIHGVVRPGSGLARQRRLLTSEAAHFVTVTQGMAESLSSVCHVPAAMITTIHNPAYSSSIVRQAEAPADHPWFTDGGPPIILSVGRLVPDKDFFTLLEAFRTVLRAEHPCRLLILGEGKLRRALQERVQSLGLAGHVLLPGWAENPYAFMSRAALFVLSSRHEAFGMVLVEALACGCPAVATVCPGPSEILGDPDLLAPVGDPNALAQVMMRALNRPRGSEVLRAKAARYSIERAAIAYEVLVSTIEARDDNRGRR